MFLLNLSKINWLDVYRLDSDVNSKFNLFFELFMWALNSSVPLKKVVAKTQKPSNKWYTNDLFIMKTELDNLYYLMLNSTSESVRNRYLLLKKEYRSALKKAKLSHNNSLIQTSSNKSKAVWSVINQTSKSKPLPVPASMSPNDFNNFFINSVDDISSSIPPSNNDYTVYLNSLKSDQELRDTTIWM